MWWWPFAKDKTFKESELLNGFTDWHTHILPGVDDGVRNMDDAMNILKQYEHIGVKEVWLTPHINEDMPNETADLHKRFEELQEVYRAKSQKSEHVPVVLHLGSENMLDGLFAERLKARDFLPMGHDGKHLLIQLSCTHEPTNLYEQFMAIKEAGYIPMLAHPERYPYMHRSDYHRLRKDIGVEFQLNLPSVSGLYGPESRRRAKILLEAGYYTHVGSDIHNLHKFFAAITEYKIEKKYLDIIKEIIVSSSN